MLLKIVAIAGLVLLTAITVIVILASRRPDEFRVSRNLHIQAPPDEIYPLIADLHAWARWSPYEKKDPDMIRRIGGAPEGIGATYEWEGDKTVGAGRMEIVDVVEPSEGGPAKIAIKLDMRKPFEGHNLVEFAIVPIRLPNGANGSSVTWAMRCKASFASKVMSLLFDMDKMVGGDFAAGLASLKSIAEK